VVGNPPWWWSLVPSLGILQIPEVDQAYHPMTRDRGPLDAADLVFFDHHLAGFHQSS